MDYPSISHHGAIRGVGGSCHQLHLSSVRSLLVDCGLDHDAGRRAACEGTPDFRDPGIAALLVTHVHLDHVGRIPELFAAGFQGPIICSEPSAHLLPLVLEDAFKLGFSCDPERVEQYLRRVRRAIVALPFDRWHDLSVAGAACRVRFRRAGHLLGSAYIECDVGYSAGGRGTRFVFSGDIGASDNPVLIAPHSPRYADVLVLESTYGNRLHEERSTRRQCLEQAIERALADRGTVLIPAFSVGRTQELLFEIEEILYRKSLIQHSSEQLGTPSLLCAPVDWAQLPIILDSPLAVRLTAAYRQLSEFWSGAARQRLAEGRRPLGFRQLIAVDSAAQHRQVVNYLASTGRPAIVIAGNGMCSGGRIVSYLKSMLGDRRHEVIFTGYQAKGTPGAVIQASEGAEGFVMIDLDSAMYEIRAKVMTLGGFSAHADQAGLVEFVLGMERAPQKVVLVHGEAAAKRALAEQLRLRFQARGWQVSVEVPDAVGG
ncbi:MBL fold metallo-hydrolase [Pseudomonas sp. SDI]|uniref:MBL fold metallo-hydrolase RNA specificity domain-containing protein n=1 Tax=Pseudomonas sp. SDI TaxID=2170734 RepID=UPI000DE5F562|nr:MBL fold metallo-hydrolase [Pseudomonas sp. SDI]PWB36026.1 MBL fold metallo-hydrolase [Pseudomonas sp. SDI]